MENSPCFHALSITKRNVLAYNLSLRYYVTLFNCSFSYSISIAIELFFSLQIDLL